MPTVRSEHAAFLDWVYQYFQRWARWPTTTATDIEFRARGDPRRLAAELGPAFLQVGHNGSDQTWRLTLRAIQDRVDSAQDIKNFLAAVRFAATRFIQAAAPTRISRLDLEAELGLEALEAQRALEIIRGEQDLQASYVAPPEPTPHSFTPHRSLPRYEDVQTIGEYWHVSALCEEDSRQIALDLRSRWHQGQLKTVDSAQVLARPRAWLERQRKEYGTIWAVIVAILSLLLTALALL